MEQYTLEDAQTLNIMKHRVREITKMLDACEKVYPSTIEASQVKHEVVTLLTELRIHGLLPANVNVS